MAFLRGRLAFRLLLVTSASTAAALGACTTETIVRQAPQAEPLDAGSAEGGGPRDDAGSDAAKPKPTPSLSFPSVLSRGGPVIKTPKVRPIVFSGDALQADITAFSSKLATSEYWRTQAAEYQVGPITELPTVTPSDAAPTTTTYPAIETWLIGKLSGDSPELGAPDPDTLYAIYYPASTTIIDDGTGLGESCQEYGGYHSEVRVGAKTVGYAVMPRCGGMDELTVSASHEYFEWATDPFPMTMPAFNRLDDAHWAWGVTMIGELADLCTFLDRDNLVPADVGFVVQRMWSNKASLAGKYPCAPAKTSGYVQAIITPDVDVDVPDARDPNKTVTTQAVYVAPGKSVTVDAFVYSDQPGTPSIRLRPLSQADFSQGQPSGFTYSLAKDQANVGQSAKVTIQAPSSPGYDILVMSAYTGPQSAHYWPVLVVNALSSAAQGRRPVVTAETLRARGLDPRGSARPRTTPTTTLGIPARPRAR